MSHSKYDKQRIALNARSEMQYLKLIAREIGLKTVGMKGNLYIKNKEGYTRSSISVIKLNRLTRAVVKALKYKRIDPRDLEPIEEPMYKAFLLMLAIFTTGLLFGYYIIPWIGGLL